MFLEKMFKYEECNEPGKPIIKNECPDVENDVIEETGGVKDEHVEGIKYEDLHIKDELDSEEEGDASKPAPETEDCNGSGGNGSSKKNGQIKKSASKVERLHFCPNCPYSSKWKQNVERHILTHPDLDRQSSGELRKFKCHYCNYKAKYKNNLYKHISVIHEREHATVYVCQQCTYQTVHSGSFHRHRHRHMLHGEKGFPHKCPGCRKGFIEKRALDDHLLKQQDNLQHFIARRSKRIYVCKFCTYKSTTRMYVRTHMALKHDQENAEKFQCHNCNYSTLRKTNLVQHLMIHSNLSVHQCPSCKKGFKQKVALDSHIVCKHREDAFLLEKVTRKIHECTLCNFKTLRKTTLGRHIKAHHK